MSVVSFEDEPKQFSSKFKLGMAFIKIKHIVINTNYIAAVKLESQTCGARSVSILMATPKLSLLQVKATFQNHSDYELLVFTGREAEVIQDYFSSFDTGIDLPQQQ